MTRFVFTIVKEEFGIAIGTKDESEFVKEGVDDTLFDWEVGACGGAAIIVAIVIVGVVEASICRGGRSMIG